METPDKCLQALGEIRHYLKMMFVDSSFDPHTSTLNHLKKLEALCDEALAAAEELGALPELHPDLAHKIVVSCDASIKENPGGPASCGVIFRFPGGQAQPLARILPTATTNNQAEYDAVYEALNYFRTFGPGPSRESIEIRTDSKLVVNQIAGTWEVNEEKLKHRHKSVVETLAEVEKRLGIPIKIVWYPRNSTGDLKQANYLAQDALGVARH